MFTGLASHKGQLGLTSFVLQSLHSGVRQQQVKLGSTYTLKQIQHVNHVSLSCAGGRSRFILPAEDAVDWNMIIDL